MKKIILSALICLYGTRMFAQDLQTVTTNGRTTNQWIQITGSSGLLSTGAGLELYGNSSTATGYVKVFNRSAGTPGTLKLQDSGGNTYINENGGNVGIGNISPAARLDVRGNMRVFDGMQGINFLTGTNTSGYALSVGVNDDGVNFSNNSLTRGFNLGNANGNLLTITSKGNIGVSTSIPMNGTTNDGIQINKGYHSTIMLGDPAAGYGGFVQTSDAKRRVFIGANIYDDQTNSWKVPQTGKGIAGISLIADEGGWGTTIDFITNTGDTYNRSMTIFGNGNVGIGTQSTGSHKLAVEGSIGARKVKVTQTGWADFVFSPGYSMLTLPELERYVQENRHLPEIPTAVEVQKDGLDLGEMNKKLLQKIEELTLYLIDLKKENTEMKQRIEKLEKK